MLIAVAIDMVDVAVFNVLLAILYKDKVERHSVKKGEMKLQWCLSDNALVNHKAMVEENSSPKKMDYVRTHSLPIDKPDEEMKI